MVSDVNLHPYIVVVDPRLLEGAAPTPTPRANTPQLLEGAAAAAPFLSPAPAGLPAAVRRCRLNTSG